MHRHLVLVFLLVATPVSAQQPPARVPPFVIDLQGAIAQLGASQSLADSRLGISSQTQLPSSGLGLHAAAHLYPVRWRAVIVGIGGEVTMARGSGTAIAISGSTPLPSVNERLTAYSPQLTLNFAGKNGWSYIGGGLGRAVWSVIPDGFPALPADDEGRKLISYGGGARWFARRRVGFSVDVRFYAMNPGQPLGDLPASPRATLLVINAGVSIK